MKLGYIIGIIVVLIIIGIIGYAIFYGFFSKKPETKMSPKVQEKPVTTTTTTTTVPLLPNPSSQVSIKEDYCPYCDWY